MILSFIAIILSIIESQVLLLLLALTLDAYPGFVTREQLKIELRDYWNGSRRATLTEWKNKLGEVLSNRDAVKVIDGHFNNDLDATKYELQHPFLKLRRRKSEGR